MIIIIEFRGIKARHRHQNVQSNPGQVTMWVGLNALWEPQEMCKLDRGREDQEELGPLAGPLFMSTQVPGMCEILLLTPSFFFTPCIMVAVPLRITMTMMTILKQDVAITITM